MKAVILAAGEGLRLRKHHVLPKGFIQIDEKPIILHSVEKLKQVGINDILIVCGYNHLFYEELASQNSLFSTLYNPYYRTYGNLYSWYFAKNWIDSDFLLLESDLLYEHSFLVEILASRHKNVFLVSEFTGSTDEVYVEAENNRLTAMSKNINLIQQNKIIGEFVGITKIDYCTYQKFTSYLEKKEELLHNGSYEENGLVELTKLTSVYCHKTTALLWCEIDNLFHLERAHKIYSSIKAKQQKWNDE